jgi:hypothetical protein
VREEQEKSILRKHVLKRNYKEKKKMHIAYYTEQREKVAR